MSYLDQEKRARKAAPILLEILEKPADFNSLFNAYCEADGLVDNEFLDQIPSAREVWQRAADPQTANEILQLPVSFREAVFFGLIRDRCIDVLQACWETNKDRSVQKRLKRIFYELKQDGVHAPAKKKKAPLFQKPTATEVVYPCYVSAADGRNERLLILNEPGQRTVRTLQIYERNGDSIVHFHYDETSRKKMRQFIDDLINVRNVPLYEIDGEFAYYLLHRVRTAAQENNNAEPSGFLQSLSRMNLPESYPTQHPYHELLDGQAILEALADLSESADLHQDPLFIAWMLDREAIMSFQTSLQSLETSNLVIDDAQQAEQIESRMDRAVDNFFTDERRRSYVERLRDAAYLLAKADKVAESQKAVALSLALEDRQQNPSSISFFRAMLTKLIEPQTKKENDQTTESGLIV